MRYVLRTLPFITKDTFCIGKGAYWGKIEIGYRLSAGSRAWRFPQGTLASGLEIHLMLLWLETAPTVRGGRESELPYKEAISVSKNREPSLLLQEEGERN